MKSPAAMEERHRTSTAASAADCLHPPGSGVLAKVPLLRADKVAKTYVSRSPSGRVIRTHALAAADVDVWAGRSVGIAGESGSGKTTLLRLMLGLESPTSGRVRYRGIPLDALDRGQQRQYRAAVQAVFQNPVSSFDPYEPIWKIVSEPMWARYRVGPGERKERAAQLLDEVGLPESYLFHRPRQISGGEAQRIAIARALSCDPEIITLDEPVTSLDVPVRGRILELLVERASSHQVTYVVVSHDLTPLRWLTDFTYIFYRGQLVEAGSTGAVLKSPLHPYTELLVRASLRVSAQQRNLPTPTPRRESAMERVPLDVGCPYRDRCPIAVEACQAPQTLQHVDGGDHAVRCHIRSGGAAMPMLGDSKENIL
jgi:peptide/nickel transport system ATP-binding protein